MNNQHDTNNDMPKREDSFDDTGKTQKINVSQSDELNESGNSNTNQTDGNDTAQSRQEKSQGDESLPQDAGKEDKKENDEFNEDDLDNPLEAIVIDEDDAVEALNDEYYELLPDSDDDNHGAEKAETFVEQQEKHRKEIETKEAAHKAEINMKESEFREEIRKREQKIEQLEEMVQKKKDETQTYFDKLVRFQAEFENFKKRSYKEKKDFKKYCLEQIMLELLPNIDNLERGLESAKSSEEIDPIIEGIQMIHRSFQNTLTKFGLQPIEAEGQIFNPAYHEAMMTIDSTEHKNNMIIEEFQKGYILHERVIRPSLVSVAKHIAAVKEESSEPEDQIHEAMEEINAQLKQKHNPEETHESERETTPPNDNDSGDNNNPTN